MTNVIVFKLKRQPSDKEREMLFFFRQLDRIKQLYVSGVIDKVFILADGKCANGESAKCCTGNEITLKTAKEICRDFLNNTCEYINNKNPSQP